MSRTSPQNADAVKEDADLLADGFRYTEDYFAKKGQAEDAVEISRKGAKLIAEVRSTLKRPTSRRRLRRRVKPPGVCKSCHDIYKPRLAR